MMTNQALRQYGTRVTPQTQKTPGRTDEVKNSAGGYVYAVDKWSRLNRWLILGSEGGSYYANERTQTFRNLDSVLACIAEDGPRTVSIIVDISQSGRAPKNDQALFALAMCASAGGNIPDAPPQTINDTHDRATWDRKYLPVLATRAAAFDALPQVARIGTHLFQFITYMEQFRKWGRGMRHAVGKWYVEQDPDKLALQLVKYRSRAVEGGMPWTHLDVLRKSHVGSKGHAPLPAHPAAVTALRWVWPDLPGEHTPRQTPEIIQGFEKVQAATTPREVAELVTAYSLPREAIPTELLGHPEVYAALLPHMGLTALARNVATMTRIGLLTNTSMSTATVVAKLHNAEAIRNSRVHPIQMLSALMTYKSGRSVRGSGTWTPVPRIIDALDEAFYLSFDNVPATGKARCIALDVSGSMFGGQVAGVPGLDEATASAAMAMVTVRTGDPYEVVAFTTERGYGWGSRGTAPVQMIPGLSGMPLSRKQRLDDIVAMVRNDYAPYMGGTDCALPMIWAEQARREFDVFEVFTDSETWAGDIHPFQALNSYRQAMGRNAKLIVVGMTSNGFSIADPTDPGMLDVVGFDTSTPAIMSAFVNDEL